MVRLEPVHVHVEGVAALCLVPLQVRVEADSFLWQIAVGVEWVNGGAAFSYLRSVDVGRSWLQSARVRALAVRAGDADNVDATFLRVLLALGFAGGRPSLV